MKSDVQKFTKDMLKTVFTMILKEGKGKKEVAEYIKSLKLRLNKRMSANMRSSLKDGKNYISWKDMVSTWFRYPVSQEK